MECILCGEETTGSIGAAGIPWPNLCQPCKDAEDDIQESLVRGVAIAMACLDHSCLDCKHVWFDNRPSKTCPNCASRNTVMNFDELPDLPDDQYYQEDFDSDDYRDDEDDCGDDEC